MGGLSDKTCITIRLQDMIESSTSFSFELLGQRGRVRAGILHTPHGDVETPVFMPVGTRASVKSLDNSDITSVGAQIILANTYHLYLRPGMETLEAAGGVHKLMNWHRPMLTDSGGFQVWSLQGVGGKPEQGTGGQQGQFDLEKPVVARRSDIGLTGQTSGGRADGIEQGSATNAGLVKVTEEGVQFSSHLDGSKHLFTPEKVIQIQRVLGADVMMVLDEAMADNISHGRATDSLARTQRWAERCVTEWERSGRQSRSGKYQALFAIIQGAQFRDLREQAARELSKLPFDGLALGGETIGYNMSASAEIFEWLADILPKEKPRYAMGLGRDPGDIVTAFNGGMDMCDCVGPTRLARNGALLVGTLDTSGEVPVYTSPYSNKRMAIGSRQFERDFAVIDPNCTCHTCVSGYTRAYLHHLYRTKELSYYRLASIHNLHQMLSISQQYRQWVITGKFE